MSKATTAARKSAWRVIGRPFAQPCQWLIQNMALPDPRWDNRWYPTRAAARAAVRKLNTPRGKRSSSKGRLSNG